MGDKYQYVGDEPERIGGLESAVSEKRGETFARKILADVILTIDTFSGGGHPCPSKENLSYFKTGFVVSLMKQALRSPFVPVDAKGRMHWLFNNIPRFQAAAMAVIGKPGDLVMFVEEADRDPDFIVPIGTCARIVYCDLKSGIWVRAIQDIPGAEEWDNEISFNLEDATKSSTTRTGQELVAALLTLEKVVGSPGDN